MAPTLSSLVLKIQIGEDKEYEYMSICIQIMAGRYTFSYCFLFNFFQSLLPLQNPTSKADGRTAS